MLELRHRDGKAHHGDTHSEAGNHEEGLAASAIDIVVCEGGGNDLPCQETGGEDCGFMCCEPKGLAKDCCSVVGDDVCTYFD